MVAHSPALTALRDRLVTAGGAFLRNTVQRPGVTCAVCTGVTNNSFPTCWNCGARSGSAGLADRVGVVTYAWNGSQSGRTMYTYKTAGVGTSRETVAMMMAYAVVAHWPCVGFGSSTPDAWAYVPSLAGRIGPHPLGEIARPFMGNVPQISISAAVTISDPRGLHPQNFVVEPSAARHVLLLDDTWVSGGHMQSAAAALKVAGAKRVTALSGARWLRPEFADTSTFVKGLTEDFDPDVCPYTGRQC